MNKKRIVVFGRTGAGKSALGNKIFGPSSFKVGNSLRSETLQCEEKTLDWPRGEPGLKVSWIDTPGFADNRPEVSNQIILKNIMDLLKTLQEGFHLALFCLPAKTRISADDIEEIQMIGKLLGKGVFDNMIIVITQLDTYKEETRKKFEETLPKDLPRVLKTHDIPISEKQIFLSNFLDFENKFLIRLDTKLRDSQNYLPKNVTQFREDDKFFLQSNEMKDIISAYRQNFQQIEQKLLAEIAELKNDGDDVFQDEIEEKKKEVELMQNKIKEFDRTIYQRLLVQKYNSDLTLIGLLKSKGLVEQPAAGPLIITVVENGKKTTKVCPHGSKDHDNDGKESNSFTWRIMVPSSCDGFEYSFRECPFSKNCLILVIRHKAKASQDFQKPNAFYFDSSFPKNGSDDQELLCEISGVEKTFKIKPCNKNSVSWAKTIEL